jgi:hypothetical protein
MADAVPPKGKPSSEDSALQPTSAPPAKPTKAPAKSTASTSAAKTPTVNTEAELAGPVPPTSGAAAEKAPVVAVPTEGSADVVYVTAPQPPRKKGNRLLGSFIALLASAIYGAALAGLFALVSAITPRGVPLAKVLISPSFYFPVALFLVGMILVVLIVNRAGWWSYLIGSIFIAVFVWLGTTGLLTIMAGAIGKSPSAASASFQDGLRNPLVLAAALLAREVAIWTGAILSWRGKRVKARNVEARAAFDREQEELAAK